MIGLLITVAFLVLKLYIAYIILVFVGTFVTAGFNAMREATAADVAWAVLVIVGLVCYLS